MMRSIGTILALYLCICVAPVHAATRVDFGDASAWHVAASDDVTASLRTVDGKDGKALCLDYDLNGTAGYASMRRELALNFPPNYAFDLEIRGSGPANSLQFKLVDASGANVWWHQWRNFQPPGTWTGSRIAKDDIDFAWGPRKDRTLTETAFLELTIAAGQGGGHGTICFDALTLATLPRGAPDERPSARDPNVHFEALAQQAPRGFYPRSFSGGQNYWTLIGIDGGSDSGLLSEDGALEIGKGGFSIEPFLVIDGKPVTWADVDISHGLRDGWLPIPSVTWRHGDVRLRVTAFGTGSRVAERLIARYDVYNDSDRAREVTLALAARPFQVDPATQFLNAPGGVSPIHALAWHDSTLSVDGKPRVRLLRAPDQVLAATTRSGSIVRAIVNHAASIPARSAVQCRSAPCAQAFSTSPRQSHASGETVFANGAALYRLHLPPNGHRTVAIIAPLTGGMPAPLADGEDAGAWVQHREDAVATAWHDRLDGVTLRLPPAQRRLADSLRSSVVWMLISRDGVVLRPGTRSYARSWIRDGAMMADALLRLGHADAARAYTLWYAPHQFSTGKVPCCVDARGSDPTPENDSPGELLHLIAQVYRYTDDESFLKELWPHVAATVDYMHQLILTQSGPACTDAKTRMFCGLLPASISHEGYSAHPQHSYWDDFWALTGYNDAIEVARALGKDDEVAVWTRQRDRFRHDLYASIRASVAAHAIDFIPGSAELGDFDPTSTTIALEPGGQLQNLRHKLPDGLLHDTFERYWHESRARANGERAWDDYTPYEWRNVGVFARLGWRDRIPLLLDFFFEGQRPPEWNGWAEVVGHDPRKPRFIGDLPHAWVASDYIRSALDLFAYQRYADKAIVLAAGVQPSWLDDGGIELHGLHTPWGTLGYTLKRDEGRVVWTIDPDTSLPPGGLILTWPLAGTPGAAKVNGEPARWADGELKVHTLPAKVIIETDL